MPSSNLKTEIEDLENKNIKKIIIATANPHKLEEINEINSYKNIEFAIVKGDFDPDENGSTYEENAYIKALAAAKIMQQISLADDSGLCVDVLNGEPGLHSARYADSQEARIAKLLENLKEVPLEKRTAHFISSMVLTDPNGNVLYKTEGKVEGIIIDSKKGTNGFGYDPVFYLPELGKTMAEIDSETKNKISHRANALNPMLEWINNNL